MLQTRSPASCSLVYQGLLVFPRAGTSEIYVEGFFFFSLYVSVCLRQTVRQLNPYGDVKGKILDEVALDSTLFIPEGVLIHLWLSQSIHRREISQKKGAIGGTSKNKHFFPSIWIKSENKNNIH